MRIEDVKAGIWRHYKGPMYLVLGVGHDANADQLGVEVELVEHGGGWSREVKPLGERFVVVYVPLQLDGAHLGPRMAVRSVSEWDDLICANPTHESYGQVSSTGSCLVERFTYLGAELTEAML